MTRGGAGNMLGVGGARQHMGREALRGGGRGGPRVGGGPDARARKRELLRTLRERREADQPSAEGGGQGSPQSVSRAAR
ncbi:DUF6243 family protein [Streptomyces sp. NRRL WC-3626]|nr:DUF6243 family protein [Streptomyces sp. NRRL WC-3626]